MGRIDPNLRSLLDSLSVEKGVRHQTSDLETLRSIVERLGGGTPVPEHMRARPEPEPTPEPAEAAWPGHDEPEGGLAFVEEESLPETPEAPIGYDEEEGEVRFMRIDSPAIPTVMPVSAEEFEEPLGGDVYGVPDVLDEDLMEFEGVTAPAPQDTGWDVGDIPHDANEPQWADLADEEYAEALGAHEETYDRPVMEAATDDEDTMPAGADDELAELERQLAELQADLDRLGAANVRPTDDEEDNDDDSS